LNIDFDRLYERLGAWMIAFGPRVILSVLALITGLWLINFLRASLTRIIERRKLDPSLRSFLLSLIITSLQVLLVLGIMQILGLHMTMFAALVGGIGVATGLALSGTLQNFTSGILILLLKPYRVGDNIVAQGMEGTVTSIQIFYTVVLTFDAKTVILPNSKLSNEVITNLSRQGSRRIDIEMKFNYGVPFELVKKSIQNSIASNLELLKSPEARIGVLALDPDGYKISVNVWVTAHGFVDKKLVFQEKLIEGLKADGIKLPGM
jgi:small conductance mechanosensitive channel